MAVVANRTASEEDFGKALRWARLAEAAHRDALAQLDNAAAIRLQLMADRLAPVLPTGIGLAGPLAAAGERPRLWIDLVLFIEMALDPKTYRLSLEGSDGRVVLFETQDPAEMAERVLREVGVDLLDAALDQLVDLGLGRQIGVAGVGQVAALGPVAHGLEVDVDEGADAVAAVAEGHGLLDVREELELVLHVLGREHRAVVGAAQIGRAHV